MLKASSANTAQGGGRRRDAAQGSSGSLQGAPAGYKGKNWMQADMEIDVDI